MHDEESGPNASIDQLATEWLETDSAAIPEPETVSVLPIDVGFDLRLQGVAIDLSSHPASEPMKIRFVDRMGRVRLASGLPRHLAIELRREGFKVELDSEI